MEISNVVRHPYFFLLPIGFVIVCAVLVFAFGFKSSVEPNFSQLSERHIQEERRLRKKKIKDKKYLNHLNLINEPSQEDNGNSTGTQEAGFSKKYEEVKKDKISTENSEKSKVGKLLKGSADSVLKPKTVKSTKENKISNESLKAKAIKEKEAEKPADDDDGGAWETAVSRKDKKNKKKEVKKGTSTPKKKRGKEEPKTIHRNSEVTLAKDSSSTSLFAISSKEKLGRNFSTHSLSNKKKKKEFKKDFFFMDIE